LCSACSSVSRLISVASISSVSFRVSSFFSFAQVDQLRPFERALWLRDCVDAQSIGGALQYRQIDYPLCEETILHMAALLREREQLI
jgi:hypothetical protein